MSFWQIMIKIRTKIKLNYKDNCCNSIINAIRFRKLTYSYSNISRNICTKGKNFLFQDGGNKISYDEIYNSKKTDTLMKNPNSNEGIENVDFENITSTEFKLLSQNGFIYDMLPMESVKNGLLTLHELGFSWWGICAVLPWIMKICIVLPLISLIQKVFKNVKTNLTTSLKKHQELQNKFDHDEETLIEKIKELKKYKYNPSFIFIKVFCIGIIQIPIHMTFFFSLRTMWPYFSDWQNGGCLWFCDLSKPDETWGLPIITNCIFLMNVEANSNNYSINEKARRFIKTTLQISSFFMIPVFIYFPSGITLYGISNVAGLSIQRLLLKNANFRKILGLKSQNLS